MNWWRNFGNTYDIYRFSNLPAANKAEEAPEAKPYGPSPPKSSNPSKSNKPKFNGEMPPPPGNCLCGERHWYSRCPYLFPGRRPANWKANPQKEAQVNEAIQNPDIKAKVDRAQEKNHQNQQNQKAKNHEENQPTKITETGVFSAIKASFSATNYALRESWIADNGSDTHVCNSSMFSRFIKTKDPFDEWMIAGAHINKIECYGTIKVNLSTPEGPQQMTLGDVAYVPDFMTNVVGLDRLKRRDVFFDNEKNHLHRRGKTLAWVKPFGGHYLLEDNIEKASFAISSPKKPSKKSATGYQWHQMLGHASDEAIQHLQASAEGVKIVDSGTPIPKTNKCQPCALAKMHRVISKNSENAESADIPFYRITYDLMQLAPALNGDQWVSHFACHFSDFHLVYTHQRKAAATEIIRQAINLIETRFSRKVVFIRSDGEKSLGGEFEKFLISKGITFEVSAPDTPAQNGHSERKGGILAMKARALRIDAGLPTNLWPEIIKTAGYLANRTPMAKHHWKTPYELVVGQCPNLSHLYQYGCKAYSLIKHLPKKEKLAERAHIGHLVGYEVRNIFRIWIPSQQKIIRTRDVIFDENAHYDPHDIDLIQVIKEPMIQTTFDPISQGPISQITEISDDEEEELLEENSSEAITEKEKTEVVEYLLTPSITESSSSPDFPAPESSSSTAPVHSQPSPPSSSITSAIAVSAPKMIGLDLDAGNILPKSDRGGRHTDSA